MIDETSKKNNHLKEVTALHDHTLITICMHSIFVFYNYNYIYIYI
jgi:hypothetical protein